MGVEKADFGPLFLCLRKRKYLAKMLRLLRNFGFQWVRRKDGTTAIEFSLMAIPFVILTLGIIELAVMYTAATLLEGATNHAARMIRTGQLQQVAAADQESVFRESLCEFATVLIRCDDVVVESIPLADYADFGAAGPSYDEDGNLISQGFATAGSNDIVLVRVAYRYTMLSPFIGTLLAGPTNSRLFMSTIVMQTEPYEFEDS
jgi:Flp pilus assembly protein TadG